MKKTTKALALALCAVLLVVGTALTTIAYLTDKEAVLNTFTVGEVHIKLDETNVDVYGVPVTGEDAGRKEAGNFYKLVPGYTYTKDPQVHVKGGSEECYVRMLLTVNNIDKLMTGITGAEYTQDGVFLLEKLVEGWDREKWVMTNYTEETNEGIKSGTYEFRYYKVVDAREVEEDKYEDLPMLFTTFTLPTTVTEGTIVNLDGVAINVVAQAIQAKGITPAEGQSVVDAAWAAFDAQLATYPEE